MMLWSLEEKL
ncbi:rCG23521 [Rattus norvegicus]|uniref:RCG23521 n=1 Tax=Rattus norvegicus TaxID=10116 RepID=A6KH69_RAT|nr:rCG23521 [Rattus norvegicus]